MAPSGAERCGSVSYHAELCAVVGFFALLCRAMRHAGASCHAVPRAVPCGAVLCKAAVQRLLLCCTVLWHAVPALSQHAARTHRLVSAHKCTGNADVQSKQCHRSGCEVLHVVDVVRCLLRRPRHKRSCGSPAFLSDLVSERPLIRHLFGKSQSVLQSFTYLKWISLGMLN
jgi:hypothetical protein